MPIDSSIYGRIQTPDYFASYQEGRRLRDLADKNQFEKMQRDKQIAMNDAYSSGVVQNPDGTMGFDDQKALSSIGKNVGGKEFLEAKSGFDAQKKAAFESKRQEHLQKIDLAARLAGMAKDQASYDQMKVEGARLGIDLSDLPAQFDPKLMSSYQMRALSAKEQLDQQNKQQEFGLKEKENNLKHQEVSLLREQKMKDRDQSFTDKAAAALDKHLSTGWTARSGQAGSVQGKINAAEAAEQLIDQGRNQPNGLDSRQIEELAQSTARLLGGTAAASARVEALVPHTLFGRAQSLKEWLSNNPQGAGQEEFVKRMAETVQREKDLAVRQMRQYQIEGLPAHSALKKKNPDLYNSILQAKGIDPSMIDEKGRFKSPENSGEKQISSPVSAQEHPEASAALGWAKSNPNDPRAQAILQRLGQ